MEMVEEAIWSDQVFAYELGSAGIDALELVCFFLSAEDLVLALPTSRAFAAVLGSDSVWSSRCLQLWDDKLWVRPLFAQAGSMRRIAAYWESIRDASRDEITADELTAIEWSSRMKGNAGQPWTDRDPWWQGDSASTRRYRANGTFTSLHGEGEWIMPPGVVSSSLVRHSREGREFPTHKASRYRWLCFRRLPVSVPRLPTRIPHALRLHVVSGR